MSAPSRTARPPPARSGGAGPGGTPTTSGRGCARRRASAGARPCARSCATFGCSAGVAVAEPSASRAPAYAGLIPMLADVAREHGYALAVHGSMQRDLDLLAAPWTEQASDAETLVAALHDRVRWMAEAPPDGPTEQPHGRRSWAITLYGGPYLDVSVMPRKADHG